MSNFKTLRLILTETKDKLFDTIKEIDKANIPIIDDDYYVKIC